MIGAMIDAIRRNHALEHATVTLMLAHTGPDLRLVGRAVVDGFYIYGRVSTTLLRECAREALARLQQGDGGLAVTPLCGTNIAVGGVLGGFAAAVALGRQPTVSRVLNACSAVALSLLAAQPVGRWVQRHLTTRADVAAVEITGIRRGMGGWVHKVETRLGPPSER